MQIVILTRLILLSKIFDIMGGHALGNLACLINVEHHGIDNTLTVKPARKQSATILRLLVTVQELFVQKICCLVQPKRPSGR